MTDLDSPKVWAALDQELQGTWSLLSQSDRMLRDLRVVTQDYDPLFACLATGVEKLLKIVHGLAVEHQTGRWPDKDTMRSRYSHAIVELDAVCRADIRAHLHTATSPGYITELLAAVDNDAVLGDLLNAVDRYAKGGRFHNLDTLADGPPSHPSPRVLFETIEMDIWKREGLTDRIGKSQVAWEKGLAQSNMIFRSSLIRWWNLYYRAALHGVLGPRAKRWLSTGAPPTV